VEVKGPNFAQPIKDSIVHWSQQQHMEVAVIRGKSNIAERRERVCAGASECISQIFGIPKGKGKGKGGTTRITVCWPDHRPENARGVVADSLVVLKGKKNLTDMRYDITISEAAANTHVQALGEAIREWELQDRTGYLLPIWMHTEADLSQCDWGRAPRNLTGPQGATLGKFMGTAQLGAGNQQQGGNAQLGAGNQEQGGGAQLGAGDQQQGGGAQLGDKQQSGGAQPDPWSGAQLGSAQQQQGAAGLGPTGNTAQQPAPASQGGAAWSNFTPSQLLGNAQLGGASGSSGTPQPPTYASTPVTTIGGSITITNPDGTPFVQAAVTPVAS
jgi:hypothetical protein